MMKFQTFKTFCLIWLFWLSVRPEYNSHRFAMIINNNHITQNNPLDLCLSTLGRKKKIGSRQGLANNDRAINEYWVLEQKYEQNSADLEQWLKMFVFNSNDTVSAFTLKVNMCRQRELSLFSNHCQEVFLISRKLSCGNKTPKGANTWAILASPAATSQQRGDPFLEPVDHAVVLENRAA